ncbi:hypothetical protein F442_02955, partial [Phytophthora nicotianae P10297]
QCRTIELRRLANRTLAARARTAPRRTATPRAVSSSRTLSCFVATTAWRWSCCLLGLSTKRTTTLGARAITCRALAPRASSTCSTLGGGNTPTTAHNSRRRHSR